VLRLTFNLFPPCFSLYYLILLYFFTSLLSSFSSSPNLPFVLLLLLSSLIPLSALLYSTQAFTPLLHLTHLSLTPHPPCTSSHSNPLQHSILLITPTYSFLSLLSLLHCSVLGIETLPCGPDRTAPHAPQNETGVRTRGYKQYVLRLPSHRSSLSVSNYA
jgi:hypothetical protein